ncbi:MAG: hypothetical protein AAGH88_06195 [Planctomycetota bacterium]
MDRIIGQTRAVGTLASQVAAGRVHHAQIFHGPPGIGKFTTAVEFAALLLCHDPVSDLHGNRSACGTCKSCRLLQTLRGGGDAEAAEDDPTSHLASAHPDLHVVTKELALFDDDAATRARKLTTIPVGVIREHLLGPVGLAATLGHGKVFIVDEAELLAGAGQNAMLKTLEEPPAGTHIILVTASEDRLLPTIRSRCQRVPFMPLTDEQVGAWLTRQSGGLDEKSRKWVIGFAQGSIGRAALAAKYGLVEWGTAVLAPVQQMLRSGRPAAQLGGAIAERVDGFAKAWVGDHKNASKEAANRMAAALMGSMISNYARRKLSESAAGCDPDTPGTSEMMLAPWLAVIEAVDEFERQLRANVNLTLCCEGLGARINATLMGVAAVR